LSPYSTEHAGEFISLDLAAEFTAQYRASYPDGPKAFLFSKSIIRKILNQEGTKGLRLYMGIDTESGTNQLQLVAVGVNKKGNDQVDGLLADRSFVCPPHCSTPNPLNGL